jgi:hypothetical protein
MMIVFRTYRPFRPLILLVADRDRRRARIRVFDKRTRLEAHLDAEPETNETDIGDDCNGGRVIFPYDGAARSFPYGAADER